MAGKPNKITEQSLSSVKPVDLAKLYPAWAPGVAYKVGEWVTHGIDEESNPRFYQVVQAHTSQSIYPPDVAKSLFNAVGFTEDGTTVWAQPFGAHDAYPIDKVVSHNGQLWKSTINGNVWAPGMYGWILYAPAPEPPTPGTIPETVPAWVQPTGAHNAYPLGAFVTYGGKTWENTIANNVWIPGVIGWTERVVTPPTPVEPPAPTIAAWKQPAGGHDAYQIGALVTYGGKTWKSTAANNVWAPGVYGWVVQ